MLQKIRTNKVFLEQMAEKNILHHKIQTTSARFSKKKEQLLETIKKKTKLDFTTDLYKMSREKHSAP